MGLFSKFNVSVANKHRSNITFNHQHTTTENFGQLSVPYYLELCPSDTVHVTPSSFARVAPLAVPTYANVNHTLRAFFVPYRVLWESFNDFITHSPIYSEHGTLVSPDSVPYTTEATLAETVAYYALKGSNNFSDSDFVFNGLGYKHSAKSKFVLKILYSLGYNINFKTKSDRILSALPLYAYFKIVSDYYTPSFLATSSSIKASLERMRLSKDTYTPQVADLVSLFDSLVAFYPSDYFTSAWESPTSVVSDMPNANVNINIDTAGLAEVAMSDHNVTALQAPQALDKTYISQQGLDWLKSLNEYVLRNNYSGSRALTRILARFGVKIDETLLNMSTYLGSISNPLTIGEVMSTADASSLGDYAGRAVFADQSNKTFDYNAKEHGILICVDDIQSDSSYVEGIRRYLMHLSPEDFYTPEFEDTTLQAIAGCELQGRTPGTDNWSQAIENYGLDDSVFGYTARYSEYKFNIDNVTGDFTIPSLNSNIKGFVLPRNLFNTLKPNSDTIPLVGEEETKINVSDIRTMSDSNQYDRIFRDISGKSDPFFFVYNFHVVANRPMKSLQNSTLLHDDPTKQPSVSINTNDIINS